jgi:hypothetical protein
MSKLNKLNLLCDFAKDSHEHGRAADVTKYYAITVGIGKKFVSVHLGNQEIFRVELEPDQDVKIQWAQEPSRSPQFVSTRSILTSDVYPTPGFYITAIENHKYLAGSFSQKPAKEFANNSDFMHLIFKTKGTSTKVEIIGGPDIGSIRAPVFDGEIESKCSFLFFPNLKEEDPLFWPSLVILTCCLSNPIGNSDPPVDIYLLPLDRKKRMIQRTIYTIFSYLSLFFFIYYIYQMFKPLFTR